MGLRLEYKVAEDVILGRVNNIPYLIYLEVGYAIRISELTYNYYFNPGHFLQTSEKELQIAKDIILDERRLFE